MLSKNAKTRLLAVFCFLLLGVAVGYPASWARAASESTFVFGNQQIGTSSNSTFGGLFLSNFTAPGNIGNFTQIQVYLATGGAMVQGLIYQDIDGVPVTLLARSDLVDEAGTNGSWISFPVNYEGLPIFNYWIGIFVQGAATIYYSQGANGTALYSAEGAMNTTVCPTGTTTAGKAMSVYAVFAPIPSGGQGIDWTATALLGVAVVGVVLALVVAVAILRNDKETKH